MIGLDGNIVNKKDEDDPYGVAVSKKTANPIDKTLPEGRSGNRTAKDSPTIRQPLAKGQSGTNNFKFPKPQSGRGDTLFDPEDLLPDEDEEVDRRKPAMQSSQKASKKHLLENNLISRNMESGRTRPAARANEGNPCRPYI